MSKIVMKILVIGLMLSTSVQAAGLLHGFSAGAHELEALLLSKGHTAVQASSLLEARSQAFHALIGNSKNVSANEVQRALNTLKVEGTHDRKILRSLQLLLLRDESEISKQDLIEAFNHLIYLSHRYGKEASTVLACSMCVDSGLAESGVRFGLERIVGVEANKMMQVIPKSPAALHKYLANKMAYNGLGDYSKATSSMIVREEEKSLALFLAMKDSSSAEARALYQSVIALSTDSKTGKVELFNENDAHRLWKIFSDDPTVEEMRGWSELLKKVASERREGQTIEEAFYGVLEVKARGDATLTRKYKILKENNCYFRN